MLAACAFLVAASTTSSGCGSESYGSGPEPILTAPPRATITAVAKPQGGLSPGSGQSGEHLGLNQGLGNSGQAPEPTPDPTLPPVSTAMVAAQERSSVVEHPPPNRTVGGSNPSVPATSGVEQWRGLTESIFPSFAVETVLRIMQCESGGNPNATGAQGEMGLLQVHPRWHRDASYDPEANLRAAYRISGGGVSFSAWSCR